MRETAAGASAVMGRAVSLGGEQPFRLCASAPVQKCPLSASASRTLAHTWSSSSRLELWPDISASAA